MTNIVQADPSVIGGVPEAPLVFLPDPAKVFTARAKRFAFLAQSSNLGPYLTFLAGVSEIQARLVKELPPVTPLSAERLRLCRENRMPPIDRMTLADDRLMLKTMREFLAAVGKIEMPEQARLALEAVQGAQPSDLAWLLLNVLDGTIPDDSPAPHLFIAAAVQIHMARLAATLPAADLVYIKSGVCPSCGARPVTSSVMATQGIENIRYATCACCATQWNEVRIKCLCCGEGKGMAYRSVETVDASVKAETCNECHSWVKIFYLGANPTLDPVADDVASLGLDLLMKDTEFKRFAFNPYLMGY